MNVVDETISVHTAWFHTDVIEFCLIERCLHRLLQ